MRILLMENDPELLRTIARQLDWEGYAVDSCYDGQEALDRLASMEYDAAILDVMQPNRDGIWVMETLRMIDDRTPVLFLTGRGSIGDTVESLDIFADDYLVKPFEPEELTARLRVLLRRRRSDETTVFTCGDLTVDVPRRSVTRGGEEIRLAAKEFALLEYMIRHKDTVLSREQIETNLWRCRDLIGSNVVDVYIRMLRRKIDEGHETKLIRTVRGSGYSLRETVRESR